MLTINRLIQENSELFSDKHCKVCSAVLISESQKLAHYQSKKHANKFRHYTSIHKGEDFTPAKRMKTDETLPQQKPQQPQDTSEEVSRNKCCPVCNMTFTSPVVAMSHYEGKTHSKNLKLKEQGGVLEGWGYMVDQLTVLPHFEKGKQCGRILAVHCPTSIKKKDEQRSSYSPVTRQAWGHPYFTASSASPSKEAYAEGVTPLEAQEKNAYPLFHSRLVFLGVPRVTKPAPARLSPGNADQSDPDKFCQLCNATFNNPHMAEQHYKGKKHKKQETKSELMTIYTSAGNTLPQTTPLKPVTPGSGSTKDGYSCDTCNVVLNSIEQYQAHVSGSKHKNNLMAMVSTHSDKPTPALGRKPYGGGAASSNRLLPPEATPTYTALASSTGGLSSSGVYSSMAANYATSAGNYATSAGNYSSSYGLSSAGSAPYSEGLLPLPSYSPQSQRPVLKNMMGPDDYDYFSQGY
ncbi:zinc finger protein 346 [Rhinoderma darwinii]|uniref:zinc finger protein 346 n=1 Tax=Rhinoderma darwinii TaxID=43563 RepID=UPI003F66526D